MSKDFSNFALPPKQQAIGQSADSSRLENAIEKSAAAQAQILEDKAAKDAVLTEDTIYYSRVDGCHYVFKDGSSALFKNGQYATNRPSEIEELNALCKQPQNHLISNHPVDMVKSDALVMREVGQGGAGTGIVNSMHLGGMQTPR
jgi:hypothetical protein